MFVTTWEMITLNIKNLDVQLLNEVNESDLVLVRYVYQWMLDKCLLWYEGPGSYHQWGCESAQLNGSILGWNICSILSTFVVLIELGHVH